MDTKAMIQIMQAYEDGKQIEAKLLSDPDWYSVEKPLWDWDSFVYRIKTTKKPVDLSVLIGSGIDCEFSVATNFHYEKTLDGGMIATRIAKLASITQNNRFHCANGIHSPYCRPRMNHIHAWQGGECPLPEGFVVKPYYRDPNVDPIAKEAGVLRWRRDHRAKECYDIIAFEVIGLADGYCYPWECDE